MNSQAQSACCAGANQIVEGATLEKVVAPACLQQAWTRVRKNKGGPGGDGVTIEIFAQNAEVELEKLRAETLAGIYRPRKVRHAIVPKPKGGERKLTIPSVVDRILQTATMLSLGQTVDHHFSSASWAYREGRGVDDALADLRRLRNSGLFWTFDADIMQYFDRILHKRLIDDLFIWVDDLRIVRLIQLWLRSFSYWGRGIAQGAPISPLLANLFLHPMDRLLELEGLASVRYADDFVVLCRSKALAQKAQLIVASHLAARGLKLNMSKTRILAPSEAFIFLGQTVEPVWDTQP
ncbi:RNA-directed DNA polymerase (Reverse transcriptase) [Rhodomicrobium vannielii ATCC 17100]|uniref:RNA-directed DNA polymerase (Reverse transcriptase) n=1 Tax=Rhodomicrobium vannielii (strain ATCC 17100 / DSM 162 / LMG 4299 / NCIMB 10020 / ATH 3.1.1) TaxID=648757 RepID=E3I077_RHOVT|nr:reverse transcriptase domain-containing protein [Rhodomicrobium vannielii]ADP71112.1 RNA-directed DNA polymerase (Reverse transcriptase) [Rhodomicrobium vannielii ATCC 17100]